METNSKTETVNKSQKKVIQNSKKSKIAPQTLGPVNNLEQHVPNDWWNKIFNAMYLKTDGDVVDDINITRKEITFLCDFLQLAPQNNILDLCCGQGRHTMELARRGFMNLFGLDRSHFLIQKAKEVSKREGLEIKFKEGDARKLPYPTDFFDAVIILGNSFGYFETTQDDLVVLREIFRILKPSGKIFIDIADGEYLKKNFQKRSWEWINKNFFVCRERSLSSDNERLVSREVITHIKKGVIADQFYAERLYSKESLCKLLKNASFENMTFSEQYSTDSQRAQDLGMMEFRIALKGQVKKEWTQISKQLKQEVKHIVVLLGDAGKPDIIKPSKVFDEDDFYTIDRMKEELGKFEGYHFSYFHKHDTMIIDLLKIKDNADLVFNLCDEGFLNEPTKELHVPALLEMLNLPYTGSGPQCLAACYDKSLVRGIAKEMGIPVPKAFLIKPEDSIFELQVDFPVIIKPNFGDSSFGITERSVAHSAEDLINSVNEIREKFGYEQPVLVEEFLTGKDLSVGIIGNPPTSYSVLPVLEEDYSKLPPELPRICGYEAKWVPESPYWNIKSIPANINDETKKNIIGWCVLLAERLSCRDYARFDWRLDEAGNPRLLEVNPNCGWCWDGHLAKMSGYADITYSEMLKTILKAAEMRLGIENKKSKNV